MGQFSDVERSSPSDLCPGTMAITTLPILLFKMASDLLPLSHLGNVVFQNEKASNIPVAGITKFSTYMDKDVAEWVDIFKTQLSIAPPSFSAEGSFVDEIVMQLPRRKAADPAAASMALSIAQQCYPHYDTPVGSLIQYETGLMKLRRLVIEQRKHVISEATEQNEASKWSKRIMKQGPWDPVTDLWSLDGAPAIPMPVEVAEKETLIPFFEHLASDGTEAKSSTAGAREKATEIEEPYYHVKCLEFDRGVLYADRRLDLCKMVVGPTHIADLMTSLKSNSFVEHFLLGNNIIGPRGARCIAEFLAEVPNQISTWYLAGNCIDAASFSLLVDKWITSLSVTNIWLKRNPLMPNSANNIFRLITQTKNLRTLDLDQTRLGDAGVASLFEQLASFTAQTATYLPLKHLYLNTVGIGVEGATALAKWLSQPHCRLDALYISNNPLGNAGVTALAKGLAHNTSLTRLSLQSVGMSDDGAIALCASHSTHPALKMLDIGQSFATPDLDSRYVLLPPPNHIRIALVPTIYQDWTTAQHRTAVYPLAKERCQCPPQIQLPHRRLQPRPPKPLPHIPVPRIPRPAPHTSDPHRSKPHSLRALYFPHHALLRREINPPPVPLRPRHRSRTTPRTTREGRQAEYGEERETRVWCWVRGVCG